MELSDHAGYFFENSSHNCLAASHIACNFPNSVPAAIEMSSLYLGSSPGLSIWSKFIHAMKQQYDVPVILAEDRMIFSSNNKN